MATIRRISMGLRVLGAVLFFAGVLWGLPHGAASGASPAPAEPGVEAPQVVNAKIETRAVSGARAEPLRGIEAQADKAEWVGYGVPEIAGDRTVCCGNFNDGYGGCGTCRLGKKKGVTGRTSPKDEKNGTFELE